MMNIEELDFEGVTSKIDITSLKRRLEPLAKSLSILSQEKEVILSENAKKETDINKKIKEIESKIRSIWGPFINGADKSQIEIDGLKLSASQVVDVKIEDRDQALDWFMSNDYKGVLKYDINTNKLKAIARDERAKQGIEIPGLMYSSFQVITIK